MRALAVLQRHADLVLRLFVWGNLVGVGADVYLAHLINDYHHPSEWIPVVYSGVAGLLLMPWVFSRRSNGWADSLGVAVLGGSVLVGVLGSYYHLRSGYLLGLNLARFVYSAPLLAPLAYTGIALVGLAARSDAWLGLVRRQWLLLLAAAGFLANGVLCLLDHAQNGFYYPAEWVAAGAALVAGFCLLFAAVRDGLSTGERHVIVGLLGLQMLVGLAGAALHIGANLESAERVGLLDGFVFGSPAMAPLLFCDVALLGFVAFLFAEPTRAAPDGSEGASHSALRT